MNCKQYDKFIHSDLQGAEFFEHLKSCRSCSEMFGNISETMAILDEKVDVPSGLTEKMMSRIKGMPIPQVRKSFDLNKYLQLAAVVTAGIFLGVLLGTRANPDIFLSKKDKKERALIEYRESHHLNDQGNINSLM